MPVLADRPAMRDLPLVRFIKQELPVHGGLAPNRSSIAAAARRCSSCDSIVTSLDVAVLEFVIGKEQPMSNMRPGNVDAVLELRLRRWARQNYVPAERRRDTWHPLVLEEMKLRDEEQSIQSIRPSGVTAYVPLMPDNIRVRHEAHNGYSDPILVKHITPLEQQSYAGIWQW
jgi:hypothetical protein